MARGKAETGAGFGIVTAAKKTIGKTGEHLIRGPGAP